jgi:hypothetical protein
LALSTAGWVIIVASVNIFQPGIKLLAGRQSHGALANTPLAGFTEGIIIVVAPPKI